MESWAPAIGMIGLALIIGATLVLSGPVGKALAEWIRGWSKNDALWLAERSRQRGGAGEERLQGELDEVKHRLAEVEERLDFTERMLAKQQPGERLAPPR